MSTTFIEDKLEGAEAIAEYLFGDPAERTKVYTLVHEAKIPVFRMSRKLCARKSTLMRWIEQQEAQFSANI